MIILEVLKQSKDKIEITNSLSFNRAVKHFGCHRTQISRTLENKIGIKKHMKTKSPKYRDNQQLENAQDQSVNLEDEVSFSTTNLLSN